MSTRWRCAAATTVDTISPPMSTAKMGCTRSSSGPTGGNSTVKDIDATGSKGVMFTSVGTDAGYGIGWAADAEAASAPRFGGMTCGWIRVHARTGGG